MTNKPINDFLLLYKIVKNEIFSENGVSKRFFQGALWNIIATIAAQGGTFIVSILVARILGNEVYGKYSITIGTATTLSNFAGLGLGLTITKYIAEYRSTNLKKVGKIIGSITLISIISGVIFCILFFLYSGYISENILNAPDLKNLLKICSILILANTLNGIQIGALSGFESFKTITKISIVRGLLSIPLILIPTFFWNLKGSVIGSVFLTIIVWVLSQTYVYKISKNAGINTTICLDKEFFGIITKFSLPAFLGSVMVGPITWLSNVILANQNGGYIELGLYNVGFQWRSILIYLSSALLQVTLPLITNEYSKKSDQNSKKLLVITQLLLNLLLIPISIFIMFFSQTIVKIYGKEYLNADVVISILIVSVLIQNLGSITGPLIQAKGKMWLGLFINLIWGGTLLVVVSIFVKELGAIALAFSYVVAYLVLNIVSYIYLKRYLPKNIVISNFIMELFVLCLLGLYVLLPNTARISFALIGPIIGLLVIYFVYRPCIREALTIE